MQHFLKSSHFHEAHLQVPIMNDPIDNHIPPKKNLSQLSPYIATSSSDLIQTKPEQIPLKLDWNESTMIPSPHVTEAIQSFLNQSNHLNWYPDLNSQQLITELSDFYQIPHDYFLVSNGSDEALHMLCATYLESEDTVVYAAPTYQHFLVFAQQEGAQLIACHYPDPFEIDLERLLHTLTQNPAKIVYLVSPNNPTGVVYTTEAIRLLLTSFPNSLFVIDEAYMEFAQVSCMSLLEEFNNLVITRTFSKAYGLAGCRIGYLMAHPHIVKQVQKIFSPKSVNVLAQVAAQAALQDQPYLHNYLAQVNHAQSLCVQTLSAWGFTVKPTPANFFMLKVENTDEWIQQLAGVGIYVRNRSHLRSLRGYLRVSVGTVEQMQDFLSRVQYLIENQKIF